MTAIATEAPRFDIGRVVIRTFGSIKRNWTVFGLLAVMAQVPTWAVMGLRLSLGLSATGAQVTDYFGPHWWLGVLAVVAVILTSSGLQAALTQGVIADLNGRRPTFADSLRTALRHLLPLIGLNLLFTIAVVLGCILLLVPGAIMAMVWFVAGPVLVVERTGIRGAFSRSAELTRGHRWALFGLLAIYFIAVWLFELAIFAAMGGVTSFAARISQSSSWPVVAASTILGLLVAIAANAGVASTYFELRSIKEGIGPDALVSVFD